MQSRLAALAATMLALTACSDAPTASRGHPAAVATALDDAASVNDPLHPVSSVRWNQKAIAFFRARGGTAGRPNA